MSDPAIKASIETPRARPLPGRANGAVTTKSAALERGARVTVPKAMRTVRHVPPQTIEIPGGEVPLIHPKDPDERQIQEHFLAEVRVFDLSDDTQMEEYREVWQSVSDGTAIVSDHQVNFSETKGTFLAYMRWSDVRAALPGQPRPDRVRRGPRVEPNTEEG